MTTEASLPLRAPFHLEATARLLQRLPANRVDRWDGGRLLRVLETEEGPFLVAAENRGTIDQPAVHLRIEGRPTGRALRDIGTAFTRMLGLRVDPAGLERVGRALPPLRPLAAALRGVRPPRYPSLFEGFANTVPFQQVSLESGTAIAGRLAERFGVRLEVAGGEWYGAPSASRVAQARLEWLRSAGLSNAKATALRELARLCASGRLRAERLEEEPTEQLYAELLALPGIGPWSAGLVLLRGLGRLDAFPSGDVGVARGLSALLAGSGEFGASAPQLLAERLGPDRGWLYFMSLGARHLSLGLTHQPEAGQEP